MNYSKLFQSSFLKEVLDQRISKNKKYSLRAFARDLKISPTSLSRVLKGERILSLMSAKKIAISLRLNGINHTKFLENSKNINNSGTPPLQKVMTVSLRDYVKIIKEWEYYAILDLMRTKNWREDDLWIAKKLNIKEKKVNQILNNLKKMELVGFNEQQCLYPKEFYLTTTEDVPSEILKKSHEVSSKMAIKSLHKVPLLLRDFSSLTTPVNLKKLSIVKKLIRKFRQDIAEIFQEGEVTEVYQMNIQLFPLTKIESNE